MIEALFFLSLTKGVSPTLATPSSDPAFETSDGFWTTAEKSPLVSKQSNYR